MSENDISTTVVNEFQPPATPQTSQAMIEASRAVQEAQAQIVAAKHFPRDPFTALNEIIQDCERYGLAVQATYCYPRGGQTVTGPSIRLAEAVAQRWGNLDYGIKEVEQHNGYSEMMAYCWDLQKNVRATRNFVVKHIRHTKKGQYKLDDPRDIYEMTANQGARRVRACVLEMIPGDVIEKALAQCKKTIAAGDKTKSHPERLQDMVNAFSKVGVSKEAIEKRLKHDVASTVPEELAELISIYNTIRDNYSTRTEFFDIGEKAASESTKKLNEKIKGNDS